MLLSSTVKRRKEYEDFILDVSTVDMVRTVLFMAKKTLLCDRFVALV